MTALVVPIAGKSSRFKEITQVPKWALEVGGKTVLERAVESTLAESNLKISKVIFVVLKEFETLLSSLQFEGHSISDLGKIVSLESTPNGQALSAAYALDFVSQSEGLLIWNGDSTLTRGWSTGLRPEGNWLLLSRLSGDQWSFARVSKNSVLETAEKKRIGPLASLGLYRFESKKLFQTALASSLGAKAERYVAPLYNEVLSRGTAVGWSEIPPSWFHSLGTPAELIQSCEKNGWSVPKEFRQWHFQAPSKH